MSQEHLDRLTAIDASFLHQEGPTSHMHVGALTFFEGPPPPYTEVLDTLRGRLHLVPRYRQKLAVPPAGHRPAAVGRRPELQPRVPRAPHGAAAPGLRGAAPAAGRADLLPAARPLQAAVGGVDGRGPRGRGLRAHHQDPPRADRRHRGRRHRPGDLRPRPGPGRGPPPRRGLGSPPGRRPGAQVLASGTLDLLRTGVRTAAAAAALATRPAEALRSARVAVGGPRRGRVGRAEPGAPDAAERRDRPAPALPRRAQRARRLQGGQGRLRRHGQRRRADRRQRRAARVAALARRAHRGRRAARARAGLDPHPRRARDDRQPDRRDARPAARSTSRTRSCACARSRPGWTA